MNGRWVLVLVGLVVFGAAILEMLLVGVLPVPLGRAMGYAVGGILLVYAYFVLEGEGRAKLEQAETADPEVPEFTPTPGDDFQRTLGQFLGTEHGYLTRTRDGLREAAVAVLTRYGGYTESVARQQLQDGTWTENPDAAAFLGDAERPSTRGVTRRLASLTTRSAYRRQVRQTVDVIAALAGVTPGTGDDDPGLRGWFAQRFDARSHPPRRRTGGPAQRNDVPDPSQITTRETHHWAGISFVALVGLGVGLLVEEPAILLSGIVGVGYAAYARAAPLEPVRLSIKRSFRDDDPDPGDVVEVTVTIANEGGFIPDLRVVDGVPEVLGVTDGSPRHGTALMPGGSTTNTYSIRARRGTHPFTPVHVMARNLPNTVEHERSIDAAGDVELSCIPSLQPTQHAVPLRAQASQYAGGIEMATGGEGVEFYATRQYQSGDAMNRVDWHRLARTGELATLEFREEGAAVAVLVIDVQPSAYVSPAPYAPHAVDRSVDAASQLFARLLADGHQVGIATMGASECWLPPAAGSDHQFRARQLLATDPAFSTPPRADHGRPHQWERRLRQRLPSNAQLLVLSPLVDRCTVRTIQQLDAAGYPATVYSPDVTSDRTIGHRLMRVCRTVSITDLRRSGIPVVEWPPTGSLEAALARVRTQVVR